MDFKVGDVVRLRSGGDKMTVFAVGSTVSIGSANIRCMWFPMVVNVIAGYPQFVYAPDWKSDYFMPEVLEKVDEPTRYRLPADALESKEIR